MTEVGDTIIFTVPRDMIGKLMGEDTMALDTQDGNKLGLNIVEIEPTQDEDTGDPDLTITAIVTYVGEVTGEEDTLG